MTKAQETRRKKALERRKADIAKWQKSDLPEAPRKLAAAKADVTNLEKKLGMAVSNA